MHFKKKTFNFRAIIEPLQTSAILVRVVGAVRPAPHAAAAAKLSAATAAAALAVVGRRAGEPLFLLNRACPLCGASFLHNKVLFCTLNDVVNHLVDGGPVHVYPVAHDLPDPAHRLPDIQHLHGADHSEVEICTQPLQCYAALDFLVR